MSADCLVVHLVAKTAVDSAVYLAALSAGSKDDVSAGCWAEPTAVRRAVLSGNRSVARWVDKMAG